MKRYKKEFKEAFNNSIPMDVEATMYKVGNTYKSIESADKHNRTVLSLISPTLCKKGSGANVEKIYHGGTEVQLRISWENPNGLTLATNLVFDNEDEAKKEGWKF